MSVSLSEAHGYPTFSPLALRIARWCFPLAELTQKQGQGSPINTVESTMSYGLQGHSGE